jgi:hypothetical protein
VRAVQGPAEREGVAFTDAAARRLVADLREVRAVPVAAAAIAADPAADANGEEPRLYPYVEPVLLQVVCNNLWRILRKRPDFREIAESDLDEVRPYHRALISYYQAVVRKAAVGDPDVERAVRDWIERKLVTRDLTRRPTSSLPKVAEDPRVVVQRLVVRYLVREDHRPGGELWELSHDLLVEPVVKDNHDWRLNTLQPWQVVAEQWHQSGRRSGLLLSGPALRAALASAAQMKPNAVERAFLDESQDRDDVAEDQDRRVGTYRLALVCSLALNLIFLVVFLLI